VDVHKGERASHVEAWGQGGGVIILDFLEDIKDG